MESLLETLSVVNNSQLQQALTPFRWVLGGAGALLTALIAYTIIRTSWFQHLFLFDATEFVTFRPYGLRRMTKKWRQIRRRLETANEEEYKIAIIEADGLLNDVLFRMGFTRGETLGDRLPTLSSAIIANIQDVTGAHEVRNRVVHDPSYRLSLQDAEKALAIYETSFSGLDLI